MGNPLDEWSKPLGELIGKAYGSERHIWLHAFQRFLRQENPWESAQVWLTVKIGTLHTADDFRQALENADKKVGRWANKVLDSNQFVPTNQESEIDLAVATTKWLTGKDDKVDVADVYIAITAHGGVLCPPDVGPQLRLQWSDDLEGESVRVAMDPIFAKVDDHPGADEYSWVFIIGNKKGELCLDVRHTHPCHGVSGNELWVFVLPRKSKQL